VTDHLEPSEQSANTRDVIEAIVLESEIKKLDVSDVALPHRRNMLEDHLKTALQRLWKDDVTAQQLGDVSDEDSDDDDVSGPAVTGHSDEDDDAAYDDTYDYLYDLYDI